MTVGTVSLSEPRALRRSISPSGWEETAPADEFDAHLIGLVGQLRNGANDQEAQAYLAKVETDAFGPGDGASPTYGALVEAVRSYLDQFPPGRLRFR